MTVGASLLLLLDANDCLDEEGRAWLDEHAPQLARVGVARPAELLARLRERLGAGWTPTPATVAFLARAGVPVTDLTPHLRTCLVCGGQVETESGTRTQTAGGTCFDTPGHYGSTAFDPDDGTSLSIAVCDPCLVARSDRVLHVAADDTPGPWTPTDSERAWVAQQARDLAARVGAPRALPDGTFLTVLSVDGDVALADHDGTDATLVVGARLGGAVVTRVVDTPYDVPFVNLEIVQETP